MSETVLSIRSNHLTDFISLSVDLGDIEVPLRGPDGEWYGVTHVKSRVYITRLTWKMDDALNEKMLRVITRLYGRSVAYTAKLKIMTTIGNLHHVFRLTKDRRHEHAELIADLEKFNTPIRV